MSRLSRLRRFARDVLVELADPHGKERARQRAFSRAVARIGGICDPNCDTCRTYRQRFDQTNEEAGR